MTIYQSVPLVQLRIYENRAQSPGLSIEIINIWKNSSEITKIPDVTFDKNQTKKSDTNIEVFQETSIAILSQKMILDFPLFITRRVTDYIDFKKKKGKEKRLTIRLYFKLTYQIESSLPMENSDIEFFLDNHQLRYWEKCIPNIDENYPEVSQYR